MCVESGLGEVISHNLIWEFNTQLLNVEKHPEIDISILEKWISKTIYTVKRVNSGYPWGAGIWEETAIFLIVIVLNLQ